MPEILVLGRERQRRKVRSSRPASVMNNNSKNPEQSGGGVSAMSWTMAYNQDPFR